MTEDHESNISKNPVITIDEKTHTDMLNFSEYEDLVDVYQNRNYIKPFEFLNKKMVLDIDENFILNEIDSKQIEANIRDNKSAFEYDASNFSKYVFLLGQFEKSNSSSINGIE